MALKIAYVGENRRKSEIGVNSKPVNYIEYMYININYMIDCLIWIK